MIIVEGPDGAGKTTLIKQLAERYNLPIAPRVVSKDAEAMVDLKKWVEDNVRKGFQPVIFDRHRLISETIYGPILRTHQSEGFSDFAWLADQFNRFYDCDPIVIYCLPPLETVMANIDGDVDNSVVWGAIEPIYTAYVSRAALDFENRNVRTHLWDYTTDGNPEVEGDDYLRYFDNIIPPMIDPNRK